MAQGLYKRMCRESFADLTGCLGFFQASMVGHKYGVLRWSKTGSKFKIFLLYDLLKILSLESN